MEDWWAEPVRAIYREALEALGGDDDPLQFGPGHICWADGNFEDGNVRFCLEGCDERREEWVIRFGEHALNVSREALEKLMAVPEEVRDCDPYFEEDD